MRTHRISKHKVASFLIESIERRLLLSVTHVANIEFDASIPKMGAMPGEIIVKVNNQSRFDRALANPSNEWLRNGIDFANASTLADVSDGRILFVQMDPALSPEFVARRLESLTGVSYAQPNWFWADDRDPRDYIPNDPQYSSQYHHPLMKNNQAWDFVEGAGITVGVADDGVMINHPDLQQNIWVNPGEIPGNGIDDDGNGYIDDVNGWDFTNSTTIGTGDNNPLPATSGGDHGTHVAGIVAARTNNGIGVAGTAGKATIVPLRFYGTGSWTATVIFNTYKYAADNGFNIVTTSYNVDSFATNPLYIDAVEYMHARGTLHFNSAGNNNQLNPARAVIDQSIYVASTDSGDVKSSFSNYGWGIDIAAPGSSILATAISGGTFPNYTPSYEIKSGTSMSTPNAAAVAALIWSKNPTWNFIQVATQLIGTADNIDAQNPSFVNLLGGGRANSLAAVNGTARLVTFRNTLLNGSTVINENQVITTAMTYITVDDTGVVNPASGNNINNWELRGAGPDNQFGTADDFLVPLTLATDVKVATNRYRLNLGQTLTEGKYRFTVKDTMVDGLGRAIDGDNNGTAGGNFSRTFIFSNNQAPRIQAVRVLGSAWTSSFKGVVGNDGYLIPTGSGVQLKSLPWMNVTSVSVQFSDNVVIGANDVVVDNGRAPFTTSNFTYNPTTRTGTWTYDRVLKGNFTLSISDSIRDLGNSQLDGEFTNPTSTSTPSSSTLPSGNGAPGGPFSFRFNIFVGDVNQDGTTTMADLQAIQAAQGATIGNAAYSIFLDVDGNGVIDGNDLLVFQGTRDRPAPPAAPGGQDGGSRFGGPVTWRVGSAGSGSSATLTSPGSTSAADGSSFGRLFSEFPVGAPMQDIL
jgi:subtilisin family serine protease